MPRTFPIPPDLLNCTLAAALRRLVPELSWAQAKRLITTRRVEVNATLCLNDARRLNPGDVLTIHENSLRPVPKAENVRILHVDPDIIVIDKPAGIVSLRRDEESEFTDERKELHPTLDELVQQMLPGYRPADARRRKGARGASIYPVHRLDRDTSGLMLFALSTRARDVLIRMFTAHEVRRTYWAVVLGRIDSPRAIESTLTRDRGDGLRGSLAPGQSDPEAKPAITRIRPVEHIGDMYTLIECELETGRTHQIRIHLAEMGHMLAGEKLYTRPSAAVPAVIDRSDAPRQALHSARLRLTHPITGKALAFDSPPPRDLATWLAQVRSEGRGKMER
jgi:23S rRNA pseudouridine1911/1915/1917 synthase